MSLKAFHTLNSTIVDMTKLIRDLPGRITCNADFDRSGDEHQVNLTGYGADNQSPLYECKIGFNFSESGESRLKNFSIHDPKQRGQGLGAQLIANLVDVTKGHPDLKQVSLTAELERGAMVWLKMGWLPEQNSFTRLQKKCLPKLDLLQQLLPAGDKPSSTVYGMFRDLLDPATTSDPVYGWSIVDSGASYSLQALRKLQDVVRLEDKSERLKAIHDMAARNSVVMLPETLAKADKGLVFLRNLDLDNLSREGNVKVAATILAWETWKGALRLDNPLQMQRLELALNKARPYGHQEPDAITGSAPADVHATRGLNA